VYWWSCPCGIKWPAHEADYLPPSNAKFKNKCSYTPTYLQGMHMDFTLTYCTFTCIKIPKKTFHLRYPSASFKKTKKTVRKMVPIFIYKASKQVSASQFHCVSGYDFTTTANFKLVKFRRRPPFIIQVNMIEPK
jgi:hypothetical protein